MAVSPSLRWSIIERDGFRCIYCRRRDVPLEVDHVIPQALGGSDDPKNLVSACEDCNRGKAARLLRTRQLDNPELVKQEGLKRRDASRQAAKYRVLLKGVTLERDELLELSKVLEELVFEQQNVINVLKTSVLEYERADDFIAEVVGGLT